MSGQCARRLGEPDWRQDDSSRRQRYVPGPRDVAPEPEPEPAPTSFGPAFGTLYDRAQLSSLRTRTQPPSRYHLPKVDSLADYGVVLVGAPSDLSDAPCRLPYDTGETGYGYEFVAAEPPSLR